jgi:hypothetical protein
MYFMQVDVLQSFAIQTAMPFLAVKPVLKPGPLVPILSSRSSADTKPGGLP